jgi:hypothetical protein
LVAAAVVAAAAVMAAAVVEVVVVEVVVSAVVVVVVVEVVVVEVEVGVCSKPNPIPPLGARPGLAQPVPSSTKRPLTPPKPRARSAKARLTSRG